MIQSGGCILTAVLYSKSDLSLINKQKLKYVLVDAEKDYFLAIAAGMIYNSALAGKIVFKGGTAIHHCYLPQSRFSEDLDFTAVDKRLNIDEFKSVLEAEEIFKIRKHYVSGYSMKINKLQYQGPIGYPNSLKIEVDLTQSLVLPVSEKEYNNVWGIKTKVNVMDIKEIFAEKIRAASDRTRYRDFFDLFLLMEHYKFDIKKIEQILSRKQNMKPINKKLISGNWEIARQEKTAEMQRVYYRRDISEPEMLGLIDILNVNTGV